MLTLRYSALLAFVLLALSSQDAAARPTVRPRSISFTLQQVPRSLGHPLMRLQRRMHWNQRRHARMSRRDIPTDLQLRANIERRMFNIAQRSVTAAVATGNASTALVSQDSSNNGASGQCTDGSNCGIAADDESGNEDGDDDGDDDGDGENDSDGEDDEGGEQDGDDDGSDDEGDDGGDDEGDDGGDDEGDDGGDDEGDGASDDGDDGANDDGGDDGDDSDGTDDVLPDGIESVANATAPLAPDSLGVDIEADDVGYFSIIQIGTPPRNFRVTIDSGSADFWVEGGNCKADSGGPCASDHVLLSGNTSSTFVDTQQPWNITYGSGDVAGTIVTDTVTIDGMTLTNHTFGVASKESSDFSAFAIPYDGLIGLALSSLSNQGVPTPIEALASQGLIKEAITSYKISRLADGGKDGEITFGALDPTRFDPSTLITIPNVSNEGFWEGSMDTVSVNNADLNLGPNRTAIFDTGTTGILAPPADATAVHAVIPGAKSDGQGGFTLPCTTNATIALTFGGRAFTIESRDLAEDPVDENDPTGECTSSIMADTEGDDGPKQWLLGDTFLKNVYLSTNVNQNSVSLAIPVESNSTQTQASQPATRR